MRRSNPNPKVNPSVNPAAMEKPLAHGLAILTASVLCLFAGVAQAQVQPPPGMHVATPAPAPAVSEPDLSMPPLPYQDEAADSMASQLEELQAQVLLLRAQTARAKAQAEFNQAHEAAKRFGQHEKTDDTNTDISDKANADADTNAKVMPRVVAIYGRDKALFADLRYASGDIVTVSPRDTLPDGHRVKSIGPGEVVLDVNGKTHRVALSREVKAPPAPFDPSGMDDPRSGRMPPMGPRGPYR